ncbi:MAG: hypothetical protein WCU80_10175 [Paludibacteraceae bacterium]
MRQGRLTDTIAPSAQNFIFCIILACILWYDLFFPSLSTKEESVVIGSSPLFSLIESGFPICSSIGKAISFGIFLLINFILLHFNEVFSFIRVRTILPPLFFLIIGSILIQPHCLSAGMLVTLIAMTALYASFFYVNKGNPIQAFNVAFLLSIASLFSISSITYVIPFILFAYSCSMLNMRTVVALSMGLILPYLYTFLAYLWVGHPETLVTYITDGVDIFHTKFEYSTLSILYISFLGILAILSIFNFSVGDTQDNIKPRKEFSHLIILFLWTLLLLFLRVPGSDILAFPLILFLSIILGRYFSLNESKFTRIAILLFAIGSGILFFFG